MSEASEGMFRSRKRFALWVVRHAAIGLFFLALCIGAVSIGSDAFGTAGAVCAFLAYLVFLFGVIGLWGAAGDWRACRVLQHHRLRPGGQVTSGDRVALSGKLRIDGEVLTAPFSQRPCAAYLYRVTGSRRRASGEGVRKQRQLALQGFAMQPVHLEADGMTLSLMALPEAEPDLTESRMGSDWAEKARGWLNGLADGSWQRSSELESYSLLLNARAMVTPPLRADHWIYNVEDSGVGLTVTEEAIPADEPVCVLGTYEALEQGLSGHDGGIIVYRGDAEQVIARLSKDMRDGARVGLICAVLGGAACLAPLLWSVVR